MLVVRGEAGMGKTALLEYAMGLASARGMRVARASGVESEMELAFAGMHLLCGPMLDHLTQLPEPQSEAMSVAFGLSAGPPPEALLVGLALLSLLAAVADENPLLCVVDDAHWFDRASARALSFAARRFLADRVCLLFAVREPMEELQGLPSVQLAGLEVGECEALLKAAVPGPLDQRVRDRVIAESRGNPLALLEWPRVRLSTELAGGFGPASLLSPAGEIEEGFRRRLTELEPSSRRFLTLAAAEPTGDAPLVWRAARLLGLTDHDAVPAVDAGLLDIDATVRFRHPSVRSATYGAASLFDRQAVHRALAEATDAIADPDRRAWHRALATSEPDDGVADELERSAARAQARGGSAAAAGMLARSAALTLDPVIRAQRNLTAARAEVGVGGYESGAALLAAAESGPVDEPLQAQIDSVRAMIALSTGNTSDAADLMFGFIRRVERLDGPLPHSAYASPLSIAMGANSLTDGVTVDQVARAVLAAPKPQTPERPHDLLVDGLAICVTAGPAVAAPTLRRALDAFRAAPPETADAMWSGQLVAAAMSLWDYETLREAATREVEQARSVGLLRSLVTGLESMAVISIFSGDLSRAATAIDENEAITEATQSSWVLYAPARLAACRGREAEGLAAINSVIERARARSQGLAVKVAQSALATFLNGLRRYEDALNAAQAACSSPFTWATWLTAHELVEAAVRSGEPDAAVGTMERLSESAQASGSEWALGIEARCKALLAGGDAAEDLYRDAVERLERSPIRPEAARAHLLYGEWLRRENRRADARHHLRAAYDALGAMGMEAFADRAARELAATGETVRKRTVDTARELTPQEVQIARLAAEGSTNREIGSQLFLSVRTVEWHISKVFTKLNVSSRKELAEGVASAGHLG